MAHYRYSVRNYEEAAALWRQERYIPSIGRHAVRLGYATYLIDTGDRHEDMPVFAIRFHATNVVAYYPLGQIYLNTGGWITVGTLERLQEFTPVSIHIYGRDIHSKVREGRIVAESEDGVAVTLDAHSPTGWAA